MHDPAFFRWELLGVAPNDRDAWLDRVCGLRELPDDGPQLPRGCVPYIPCSVDVVLRAVEQASIQASDVFVDVGAGVGRAAALVHLLTGASVVGIEIQPGLVRAFRDLMARLVISGASCIEGDAAKLTSLASLGSVFFLYCPFGEERLAKVLAGLEDIAQTQTIRVCCVDMPPLARPWLTPEPSPPGDLVVYRSA